MECKEVSQGEIVCNEGGTELPLSGGTGVQAILMAGLLLIIAAAAMKGLERLHNR